jgi:hypothetical protein
MNTPKDVPEKKPYRAPVLQTYGTVRQLTRNIGNGTRNDPGNGKIKT